MDGLRIAYRKLPDVGPDIAALSRQERPRSISFEMTYNDKNVTVLVLPGDGDFYGVFISFKFVSILQRDDHGRWHDKSNEIDHSYVELIGLKIDADL